MQGLLTDPGLQQTSGLGVRDAGHCDGVLASDLTWVVVRVGLEDSLTAALQAVKGGDLNGTVDMWAWLQ